MDNKLSLHHPELADQWSEKNVGVTFDSVTFGSNKLYWWRCQKGHEWQSSPKSRSSGEGCPYCSGKRVLAGYNDLATLRPDIASEWVSEKNGKTPQTVTIGSHVKALWRGSCGHEWTAVVKNRVNGAGCPYCSGNRLLKGFNDLATVNPKLASEWNYKKNKPLLPSDVSPCINKKVWWKCDKGHEWFSLISTRAAGSPCPYCSGTLFKTDYNDLATTHPDITKEWSDKNVNLQPTLVNFKSHKVVWWQCKKCGHEWKLSIYRRTHGSGCPVCEGIKALKGVNDLTTTDPDIASEWDYERNKGETPEEYVRTSLYSFWWKGKCGHSWRAKIADRTINKQGCTVCEAMFIQNLPKLIILLYAKRNKIKVKLDTDDEIGIPLDVFFPETNVVVELKSPKTDTQKRQCDLKQYLCEKRGFCYVRIHNKKPTVIIERIKKLFRENNIYIDYDLNKDLQEIRKQFVKWIEQG